MLNLLKKLAEAFCDGCEMYREMLALSGLDVAFPSGNGYPLVDPLDDALAQAYRATPESCRAGWFALLL